MRVTVALNALKQQEGVGNKQTQICSEFAPEVHLIFNPCLHWLCPAHKCAIWKEIQMKKKSYLTLFGDGTLFSSIEDISSHTKLI